MSIAPENVNIRVFLAAYMVAYFPSHVFETMGPLEQALFDAATPMIVAFEAIMGELTTCGSSFRDVPYALTKDFPTLLFEFLRHFRAWKVPDEVKLVARIKHALVALYEAQSHLPADEDPESKLNVEFRTQIWRLRMKLSQIAGETELRKFDDGRVVQPPCQNPSDFGSSFARMTNEQLAHELLIDPEFQLNDDGDNAENAENEVYKKIRHTFHLAFWSSLVDDLKLAYPCYVRVLRVLEEIRVGLGEVTRQVDEVSKCIDMGVIHFRSNSGVFSIAEGYKLIESVVAIIERMQLQRREAETAQRFAVLSSEMRQTPGCPSVFCKGLEFLLERLNIMRIDAANSRLRAISPVIRDHGIDYERGKFQERINAGTITLRLTTSWLKDSMDAGESDLNGVVTRAMLNTVSTFDPKMCPETMMFESDRLQRFNSDFFRIVSSMVAIICVRHRGGDVDDMSRKLAEKMDIVEAVAGVLKNEKLEGEVARQALDTNDSIYKLMGCRVRFQYSMIVNGGVANPAILPAAVRGLFPLITQSALKIKRVVEVNKLVHGETYAAIIGEHVKKRKPSALPHA